MYLINEKCYKCLSENVISLSYKFKRIFLCIILYARYLFEKSFLFSTAANLRLTKNEASMHFM